MASELSRKLRNSGNQAYVEGCSDYLAPVLRSGRLLKASKFYRQAFDATRSEDERAKCSKNLGAVHWKHAKLFLEMFPEGKGTPLPERSPCYDIGLSFQYYFAALRHGRASNQSAEWRDTIKKKMEEISRFIVDQGGDIFSTDNFLTNVNKLFGSEVSSTGKSQAWALLLFGYAQNTFERAVKELRSKDADGSRNYRHCLTLLHLCHSPIEEAKRRCRPEFLEEINTLKTSVDSCRLTCESIQARAAGKKLLEESSRSNDSAVRHDLVINALDKFKEAAVIARGVDAECEAEAMAQVGDVYREIFKKDQQAHPYYNVAVLLAQNSDAMLSAKWYQRAKVALNLFFKKRQESAAAAAADEDSDLLPEVKKEVEKLEKEFKKLNTEEFLKYLYREYPPRGNSGSSYRLGELSTGAATRHALRKAIQHYHPDHNSVEDDPKWIMVCGEITKLLLERHRVFSNEKDVQL